MKKAKAKTTAKVTKRKVSPIPKGYHSVTPYLSVRGGAAAIEFYKKAFGAKEIMRIPGPKGNIGHAEIEIGGSRIMIADEYPEIDFLSPAARGGTTVTIHLYVPDADRIMQRATEAGGTVVQPMKDQFYGDRTGSLRDPFGHVWHLATHKEDLSMAELKKRAEQAAKGAGETQARFTITGGKIVEIDVINQPLGRSKDRLQYPLSEIRDSRSMPKDESIESHSSTTVDDIETYIHLKEKEAGKQYLQVADLPMRERDHAIRELLLMGITAGLLFPGLDGACEELRERFFGF